MSASKARLLIVDDNELNRDLLGRRLTKKGFDVIAVADGVEAMKEVEREHYDLVILDIMMPGVSGLEVLEEIRKSHSKAALPILMATAKTDSQDVVQALSLGANDYVTKPLDFPVVLARIEHHLSLKVAYDAVHKRDPLFDDGVLEPGTVLEGRYRVEDIIGEGGFAIVYRACQLSTGQTVALKLLRADRLARVDGAETELARFERETSLIGQLNHPNVVRLVDSGTLKVRARGMRDVSGFAQTMAVGNRTKGQTLPPPGGGTVSVPYLVMEYLEGESLGLRLGREGRLTVTQTVDIMLPVISALDAAHKLGVIHRDLKPPNVFISRDSSGRAQIKVLDFGIAKFTTEDQKDTLTRTMGYVGTPEYMSPEQARGEKDIDWRSDQYAVAIMMYECISGCRPFDGETLISLIHQIANGRVPDVNLYLSEPLPGVFHEILRRAMHTLPEKRFPALAELSAALRPFASEETLRAY